MQESETNLPKSKKIIQIVDRGIVFDASTAPPCQKCSSFMSLIRVTDGRLLCGFKTGPKKVSPGDTVRLMQSHDEGKTWQLLYEGFDRVYQNTPGSLLGGYLVETDPGRLMISLFWVDRTDPTLQLSNPETTGLLPFKMLLTESEDGGKTWGAYHELNLKPQRGASITGRAFRLNNGDLIQPYECWKEWDDQTGSQSACLKRSTDQGKTWGDPIFFAFDPNQKRYYWDNRLAQHPDTGQLVAMFWTYDSQQGVDEQIHMAYADCNANHWTLPIPTGIQGQIAAPLMLGESRMLCAYVHRHDPPSMRVVLSDDLGKTWDLDDELVIYESEAGRESGANQIRSENEVWADMYRWTFGHPAVVQIDSQVAMISFYAGTLEQLSIHWVKVRIRV